MKNVLIVEDELLVAENMAAVLEEAGFSVTGIATSAVEALEMIKIQKPQLAILDINIEGSESGIDLARKISSIAPMPFVYVTALSDQQTLRNARETNPNAFLVKPYTNKQLLATIELVFLTYYQGGSEAPPEPPSRREREILEHLAKGFSSKQIGHFLNISELTVQTHRRNMMSKYKTISSNELIALATKWKWI